MTTKRKPGPAKGALTHGNAGRKPAPAQSLESVVFVTRCSVFDRRHYPGHAAICEALGISRPTFQRRLNGAGDFTTDQVRIGNELLDKAAPWVQQPAADTVPSREDAE